MDYPALKALIEGDQAVKAMAEAGNDSGVAAALNAPTIPATKQYMLTTFRVLAVLGMIRGTQVMAALRASQDYAEVVRLMDNIEAGIDVNYPGSDLMFAALVAGGVLTSGESAAILALRNTQVSRAVQTLGVEITHTDVAVAWRS